MKSLFKIIFAIIALFGVSSCERSEAIDGTSSSRTLKLTVEAIENNSATTRVTAGTTVIENGVKNIWVLQFDASDAYVDATYYDSYPVTNAISINTTTTTVWVIANTFSTSLFTSSNCATLTAFEGKYFELSSNDYRESGMWVTDSDVNYLRMSGSWSGSTDSEVIIGLTPLAAKISLTFSCSDNTTDNYVYISSIQLNSVPMQCYYSGETSDSSFIPYQEYTLEDGTTSESYTFYMPQNKQGTVEDSSSAAEKSENAPTNATYIVLYGTYYNRYYNSAEDTDGEIAETPIIIKVYPGENSIDDYNIALGTNYNVNCTISCDYNSWSVDSRVVTTVDLPEGAVIHYEFDPVELLLNSAYNADGTTITACYTPDYDSDSYPIDGGVVVSRDDGSPFIRNLAMSNDEYLTQYDCREITDNKFNYLLNSNIEYTSQLSYIAGNKYVSSSLLALDTEWGSGRNPSSDGFTIVFIGSSDDNVGVDNNQNGSRHHIYTPGGSGNSHRWYFMKFNTGQMVYGLQSSAHQYVDDFVVNPNEVFLSFDIANSDENKRQVYFNNIKLTDATYTSFAFDRDFSIMGNIETTSGSSSPLEANDGRIYLFLIYEKVLSIEEITQIKNYATLKGLI